MTLVSEIITDAFRQSNLLAIGASPTSLQTTEALRYLNRIVLSVLGNEVGEPLTAFPLGREDISRPSGYPYYDNVPDNEWFVPKNLRVMCNLSADIDLYLHPEPDDGTRFGLVDVKGNLATNSVTVHGNGRNIEGNATLVVNTNDYEGEWVYRADLGNWQKVSPLIAADTFPFPEEFDFFFIIQLALAMNPAYGVQMDQQTTATWGRAKSQLRARYAQSVRFPVETGLTRLSRMAADRDRWFDADTFGDPTELFYSGYPY